MMTHPRTLRFARALFATNLKASVALRGAFAMQVALMALNNLTFFVFWWVLMRRVPDIRGWRLSDVEVLYGIVAIAVGLSLTVAGGVRHLGRLIDDGELDTLLVQPPNVLVHAAGLRSQASGFGDMLSGAIVLAMSGTIGIAHVAPLVIAIAAAACVFVASGIAFFSAAFWLGRVETVARQLWDLLITFAIYPEPLFGGALRLVLFTIVPAGWVGYVPARIAREASFGELLALVAAAGAYLAVAVVVFHRGLRRYASGSRFGTFG